ncbi:MAG: hypothetical protein ONB25_06490 [candidate division KSB1 bacterium]|nr:hypothetical protein [candidate division KSB1 bacterium]MDZ7412671.1 hypothetical protein [candidate division KSB1 bacterium]
MATEVEKFFKSLHFLVRSGHSRSVTSVAFSPSGEVVASGSRDGTVMLWAAREGILLATLLAFSEREWITYIPEGYYIGSEDVERRVTMKVEQGGQLYPAALLSRDNPNPQKVAEALARARGGQPKPQRVTTSLKAVGGAPLRQLGPGKTD